MKAHKTSASKQTVVAYGFVQFSDFSRKRTSYLYLTFFKEKEPVIWISDALFKEYSEDDDSRTDGAVTLKRGVFQSRVAYPIKHGDDLHMLDLDINFSSGFTSLDVYYEMNNTQNLYRNQFPDLRFASVTWLVRPSDEVQCCGRKFYLGQALPKTKLF